MPGEYFSGKCDKDDEAVSEHVEGSSPWKRWSSLSSLHLH